MSGWLMWVAIRMFEHAGAIREGLRSISVEHDVEDKPNAPALAVTKGALRIEDLSHHYGKGTGGLNHVTLDIPARVKIR